MGRISPHHATIVAMYAANATRKEIAAAIGELPRSVDKYMNARDMPSRPLPHVELMNEKRDEIAEMRRQKVKHADIAAWLGLTESQVKAYCDRNKIASYSKTRVRHGNFSFSSFSKAEITALGVMAHAQDCEDLAQVVTGLVRTAIAEYQKRATKRP